MNLALVPKKPIKLELVESLGQTVEMLTAPEKLTHADRWRFADCKTHAQATLRALKMKNTLTPHEAKEAFGCFRLASVINRLNAEVETVKNIQKEFKVNYAVYTLVGS